MVVSVVSISACGVDMLVAVRYSRLLRLVLDDQRSKQARFFSYKTWAYFSPEVWRLIVLPVPGLHGA